MTGGRLQRAVGSALLPELALEDLPRRIAGQGVEEGDLLGDLEAGQLGAAVLEEASAVAVAPGRKTTKATGTSPHRSSGRPTTAASSTASCS